MGMRYTVVLSNAAQVVGTDFFSLTAAANRSIRIVEINYSGNGSASAANILEVARFATAPVGAPAGAITPRPLNSAYPAAVTLAQSGAFATSQPTGTKTVVKTLSVNSNGGIFNWKALPGGEIDVQGGGQATALANISFRPLVGTGVVSLEVTFEEV